MRNTLKSLNIEHEAILTDGDRVAVRSVTSSSHDAEFLGVPATGKKIAFRAFDLHELRDGKIAHSWHLEDLADALAQLGATTGHHDQ